MKNVGKKTRSNKILNAILSLEPFISDLIGHFLNKVEKFLKTGKPTKTCLSETNNFFASRSWPLNQKSILKQGFSVEH